MSIRRLFCSRRRIEDGVFTVGGDEAYHGTTVLRLRKDDEVRIFTEQGSEFLCRVMATSKGQLRAEILEKLEDVVESPLQLHLIQAMPKAAKLEQIIVHGTELGMTALHPVFCERSVKTGEKRERWRKLALEAAKQSGRRHIPFIHPATKLTELDFAQFDGFLKFVAAEPPLGGSLRQIVETEESATGAVVVIGPEGGFASSELEFLTERDFKPFTLGPRILRTQTASLAVFAVLQYLLGDWDA